MRLHWAHGPILSGDNWAATISPNYDLSPWHDIPHLEPCWFGVRQWVTEVEGLGKVRRWILCLGLFAVLVSRLVEEGDTP